MVTNLSPLFFKNHYIKFFSSKKTLYSDFWKKSGDKFVPFSLQIIILNPRIWGPTSDFHSQVLRKQFINIRIDYHSHSSLWTCPCRHPSPPSSTCSWAWHWILYHSVHRVPYFSSLHPWSLRKRMDNQRSVYNYKNIIDLQSYTVLLVFAFFLKNQRYILAFFNIGLANSWRRLLKSRPQGGD